jgi:hypothetical protein
MEGSADKRNVFDKNNEVMRLCFVGIAHYGQRKKENGERGTENGFSPFSVPLFPFSRLAGRAHLMP